MTINCILKTKEFQFTETRELKAKISRPMQAPILNWNNDENKNG